MLLPVRNPKAGPACSRKKGFIVSHAQKEAKLIREFFHHGSLAASEEGQLSRAADVSRKHRVSFFFGKTGGRIFGGVGNVSPSAEKMCLQKKFPIFSIQYLGRANGEKRPPKKKFSKKTPA